MDDIIKTLLKDNTKTSFVDFGIMGKRFRFSLKDGEVVTTKLMMNHGNKFDLFDLEDESDGTKRLFDLIPLYKKSNEPCVIFIDELDRSFHTRLTIEFLQKFFEDTIDLPSQMIVTLHDASVMDLNWLRQDEIWFVERNEDHASSIYSLNKFKERYDKDISKDYMLGRYGAIPCFNTISENEDE